MDVNVALDESSPTLMKGVATLVLSVRLPLFHVVCVQHIVTCVMREKQDSGSQWDRVL